MRIYKSCSIIKTCASTTLCFEMDYLTCALIFVSIVSNSAAQPPQKTNPLGVRYSAATDVSHVSFSSPLVTYGSALNEIQLPAAPIQPTIKKPQPDESQDLARSQQPAQLQSPQGFSLSQPQTVARFNQQVDQPQYPVRQPQYSQAAQPQYPQPQYSVAQPQYSQASQPQYPQPQYAAAQPQYPQPQYSVAQPQYSQASQPQYPQPQYAAAQPQYPQPQYTVAQPQYPQPQYPAAQPQYSQVAQPQYTQPQQGGGYLATQPPAPLVSRVAFNGPLSAFSYSF